jgi:putative protein-disulfide isomerase
MSAILHFIYDPLCGWCYCAEPLVNAAEKVPGLEIRLHGGGLWPEPTILPAETRAYIRQMDERAARISGQPYGKAYLEGLLPDPTMTLESRPTTAAVLAAEALAGKGLEMLRGIQHAHYERGLKVVEAGVLRQIAEEVGLDGAAFASAIARVPVDQHISNARRFMQQIGAGGFPAFVLEAGSQWFAVPHQRFASNPAGFAEWLGQAAGQASATAARDDHPARSH